MDLARLTEFEGLFKNRWRAFVLVCLLDEPMRFSQLAAAMQRRTGPDLHVPDSRITSSLQYLRQHGLVRSSTVEDGKELINTLTAAGAHQAERIWWVFTALDHLSALEQDRETDNGHVRRAGVT